MNKWMQRGILALILLVAAALRLTGIDWDDYDHHHPDERYITWVATTIEWPTDWTTALNPAKSTFNPFYWPPQAASKGIEVAQDEQRKFAYGHFPLYLGVAATRLMERVGPILAPRLPADWLLTQDILNGAQRVEYRHLTAVTRALTALFDVGTVWMLFLLGQRLYGTAVGLLAAAFLALNVMHIQLAHFFAFDPYVTFFVVTAVYLMVLSVGWGAWGEERGTQTRQLSDSQTRPPAHSPTRPLVYLLLAAVFIGLAVGSKFAAVLLFLPLALTVWFRGGQNWEWWMGTAVLIAGLTFFLTNPFAILDLTCEVITPAVKIGPITIPALDWRSCLLDNVGTQGAMVRGDVDFAFTRQYSGTLPYLYYIEMQFRWGMGPLLGLLSFTGFAYAIWQSAKQLWAWFQQKQHPDDSSSFILHPSSFILLFWTLPFFLTTGSFFVKFMRYLQPLVPFLMLYGAALLWQWRQTVWRWIVVGLVLATTGWYALSFVGMYDQPHPWTAVSRWIYANVEPGTLILSEQWDDALPVSMFVDNRYRRRSEYRDEQLTWMTRTGDRDDEAKLVANLDLLAEAEYLTLVTNRVYGVVPRLPDRYPISSQYTQLLFDGKLGYEVVAVNGRFPHLFNFYLKPDSFGWPGLRPPAPVSDYLDSLSGLNWGRADESFTVYDQPLTIVFENVEGKTAVEMQALFELD